MSLKEYMKMIGKTIGVRLSGLTVQVNILDVRSSFGRTEYQITPVQGSGAVWIVAPKEEK